jgi:prevent-host-death family protein
VRQEPLSDAAGHLDQLADEVETKRARVVLTRPGHADVVLLSADELESLEETLFWMRDEEERAAEGEAPGDGEQGPGLNEDQVRAKYGHLLNHRDTA